MKAASEFLSDVYRTRLYVCYNCRINFSIRMIWGVVSKFLEEETVNKINLF